MECVPTFTMKKSTIHVGKYTVRPMDGMGMGIAQDNMANCQISQGLM